MSYDARSLVDCTSGVDCSLSLADVQRKAWGKTHYFDKGTLRFFGSRISRIRQDGSEITCVESAQVGWSGVRKRRFVVFDVLTGQVDHIDYALGNAAKAERLFREADEAQEHAPAKALMMEVGRHE